MIRIPYGVFFGDWKRPTMRCFLRQVKDNWHAAFDFGGVSYTQSLRTKNEVEAEVRIGPIKDTLYRLESDTLALPPGANPKTFITSSGNHTKKQEPDRQLTVNEVSDRFIEWATSYYVKDNKPTNQVLMIRLAIIVLSELYGRVPASTFGPLALKECREQFIKQGLARTEVNRRTRLIVQAFRWAVESELIPAVNLEALKAVKGLPKGRSAAHESDPVRPVPDAHVDAILPQGLRTTFSCVFEGFSRERSSHYIINTNCNALYSPIHYRKVANV